MPISALTTIWQKNQGGIQIVSSGMPLWHCGHIACLADVNDGLALWTTRSEEKKRVYESSARQNVPFIYPTAALLSLKLKHNIRVANFNEASLLAFTIDYCGFSHDRMKQALRQWCQVNSIDGIVSLNGDADEVVVINPTKNLEFVHIEKLSGL
jgi:hypothetical protein